MPTTKTGRTVALIDHLSRNDIDALPPAPANAGMSPIRRMGNLRRTLPSDIRN